MNNEWWVMSDFSVVEGWVTIWLMKLSLKPLSFACCYLLFLLAGCGGAEPVSVEITPLVIGTLMPTAVLPPDAIILATPEPVDFAPNVAPEVATPRPLPTRATGYNVLPTPDPPAPNLTPKMPTVC
jgi:hypothetical protein